MKFFYSTNSFIYNLLGAHLVVFLLTHAFRARESQNSPLAPSRRPGVEKVRTDELTWPALRCQETDFASLEVEKELLANSTCAAASVGQHVVPTALPRGIVFGVIW